MTGVPSAEALEPGQRLSWSRSVTAEDVRRFAELSGDFGAHHVKPDASGRVMAHGLLTATLPTKLGGDLNYMARTMEFEFIGAVYSGDTLLCEGVVESLIRQSRRLKVRFSFTVKNQAGALVLKGGTAGMIPF